MTKQIEVAVGDHEGDVVLTFSQPTQWLPIDPQQAFQIAESLARAAHIARFGKPPQSDGSYIAQQVRARITEDMRDRMVARVALMLHSLRETPKSDGEVAMHLVDAVLSGVGA